MEEEAASSLSRMEPNVNGDTNDSAPATDFSYEDLFKCEKWKNIKTHIFILSSAGKPVYSRAGSEDKLVTLFGVMQALVSFVSDSNDTLQSIHAGKVTISFLSKGPIILVSVSKNGESKEYLNRQLLYVYNQVVSVLTLTQVTRIFEQRRNFDLRRLLTGSERLIDHLLQFTENSPEFLFSGIICVPLMKPIRDLISNTIISCCSKIKNVVFALVIADNRLVSLVRMKKYNIEPSDLHLLFNMICSSESFKTAESWTPICLPNFDSSGFLYAHVSYLDEECCSCLVLLTVDRDSFYPLSEAKQKIFEKLEKNNVLTSINEAVGLPPYSITSLNIVGLRHFIYKCTESNQLLVPMWKTDCSDKGEFFELYQDLVHFMVDETAPSKIVYRQFPREIMLGLTASKFELYAIFDPSLSKSNCIECVDKIFERIEKEKNILFISNIPTF